MDEIKSEPIDEITVSDPLPSTSKNYPQDLDLEVEVLDGFFEEEQRRLDIAINFPTGFE